MSDHAFFAVWTSLVAVFLATFGVFETWAFVKHKPDVDTLSAWVWARIGTRAGWHLWNTPLRVAVLLLFLWLAEHFTFGWI